MGSVTVDPHFNSIKVRLRPAEGRDGCAVAVFQFHKGSIKTSHHRPAVRPFPYFNSIKVRLRQGRPAPQKRRRYAFQFHKGSIKTLWRIACTDGVRRFQFHKGSIKTIQSYPKRVAPSSFQFHKGSIKTANKSTFPPVRMISIP